MKKRIPFLLILFFGSISGQNIKGVKKIVADINHAKNYTIKTVPNSYYLDNNQITDNGIELKGYYKEGKLKKMEYFVGLSAWNIVTEYFFSKEDELVFVHSKKYQIVDENGYLNNPKLLTESRYYYKGRKLIKVSYNKDNIEKTDYFNEIKALKKDLENYK
jgi:hypothetical protein